jgi:hypothetical protein
MATELEQFVEANQKRLAEVNASNPPLYSAISLALDYLNKNYFGGTSEIKVEIPSETPQITETNDRIFTDSELEKLIFDNVWTLKDFKEIKIELKTDVQKTNFTNLIKKLVGGRDSYVFTISKGNYFYSDEDLVIFNDSKEKEYNFTPYQKLFYNEIFKDLLQTKAETTETLPTFWDKADCSKNWYTKIDYDYLIKSLKSKRRSKEMKLEIARAFGEICYIIENTKEYLEAIDYYVNNTSVTKSIYRYQFDEKVKEIFEKNGFDEFDIVQFSDLETLDWTINLVFPMFEQALKIDTIVDQLIEYYKEKIGVSISQPNVATPSTPSAEAQQQPQLMSKIQIRELIKEKDYSINTFLESKIILKNDVEQTNFQNLIFELGGKWMDGTTTILDLDKASEFIMVDEYGQLGYVSTQDFFDKSSYFEFDYDSRFTTNLVNTNFPKIEVGDWVELNANKTTEKGVIAEITQILNDEVTIKYLNKKYRNLINTQIVDKSQVDLVYKQAKPDFKLNDVITWKEKIPNYSANEGATADVVGFGVWDGNLMVEVEWVDTKRNMKFVNGQGNGLYLEDDFKLLISNEELEAKAKQIADKITTKTATPQPTPPPTPEKESEEEDFEDLANQLEDLDF